MRRLCIVGIGSPFGDDTLGWEAVSVLEQSKLVNAEYDIVFKQADRPGAKLLDIIAGESAVVLIDAMRSAAPAGTVHSIDRDQLDRHGERMSSHALGVAEVLVLGEILGDLPDRLWLIGIEVGGVPQWEKLVELVESLAR